MVVVVLCRRGAASSEYPIYIRGRPAGPPSNPDFPDGVDAEAAGLFDPTASASTKPMGTPAHGTRAVHKRFLERADLDIALLHIGSDVQICTFGLMCRSALSV